MDWVNGVAVTKEGHAASDDGTLKVWDLASGAELATLPGHMDWVNGVAVTREGRAVSASDDGTLKVWDLDSGAEMRLGGHTHEVWGVAVTEGRAVSDGYARSRDRLATLRGHEGPVWGVAGQERDARSRREMARSRCGAWRVGCASPP